MAHASSYLAATGTEPWRLDLTFTAPTPPLSTNQANGMHWSGRRARLKPWGSLAWAVARNARIQHGIGRNPVPVLIATELPFGSRRTRDPHNYVGTVVKAMVDGIVRAGVVPDDNEDWVTVTEPRLTVGSSLVRITITPRET